MLDSFRQVLSTFFTPNRLSISICLVMATVGWFLTKMSKEYNHQIRFALQYHLPNNLAFESNPITAIDAEIRAKGWSLLSLVMSDTDDTIHLEEAGIFDRQISARLLLSENINQSISDGMTIINAAPEQISLKLVERQSKKVPIRLNGELLMKAQYQLKSPPWFDPDSVTIFGAQDQLDKIVDWPTVLFDREEIDHDIEAVVSLTSSSPAITTSITQSTLHVNVDQVTEKEIYVAVSLPDSLSGQIRIFPKEVLVKINLGLSEYDQISASDFEVTLKNPIKGQNVQEVIVNKLPDHVTYITHTPKMVDFYRSYTSETK